MKFTIDRLVFEWQENWAKVEKSAGHAHHGLALLSDNNIITAHNTLPYLLILSPSGELIKEIPVPVTENHGITVVNKNSQDFIWIADTGKKQEVCGEPQFLKVDLNGKVIKKITRENLKIPKEVFMKPTVVAIDQPSGKTFFCDGYGTEKIYCLDKNDQILFTIDGTNGAGKFSCAHWIFIDRRKNEPELYVADRSNHIVQIYDLNGQFKRAITDGLETPSVFTTFEEFMIVGELNARLVFMDLNDNIIGTIGSAKHHVQKKGWPNRIINEKKIPPTDILLGEFNSPHGIAADHMGNIYISEWLLGDRFTKLCKVEA